MCRSESGWQPRLNRSTGRGSELAWPTSRRTTVLTWVSAFPRISAIRTTTTTTVTAITAAGTPTTAGTICGTIPGSVATGTTLWATSDPGGTGIARCGVSSAFRAGRPTGSCTITGTDSPPTGTVDGAGIPATTARAGTATATGPRFVTCTTRTTAAGTRLPADTDQVAGRRRAAIPAATASSAALPSSVLATRRTRRRFT